MQAEGSKRSRNKFGRSISMLKALRVWNILDCWNNRSCKQNKDARRAESLVGKFPIGQSQPRSSGNVLQSIVIHCFDTPNVAEGSIRQ